MEGTEAAPHAPGDRVEERDVGDVQGRLNGHDAPLSLLRPPHVFLHLRVHSSAQPPGSAEGGGRGSRRRPASPRAHQVEALHHHSVLVSQHTRNGAHLALVLAGHDLHLSRAVRGRDGEAPPQPTRCACAAHLVAAEYLPGLEELAEAPHAWRASGRAAAAWCNRRSRRAGGAERRQQHSGERGTERAWRNRVNYIEFPSCYITISRYHVVAPLWPSLRSPPAQGAVGSPAAPQRRRQRAEAPRSGGRWTWNSQPGKCCTCASRPALCALPARARWPSAPR